MVPSLSTKILPGGHHMVVFRGLILYDLCGKACIDNPTTRQRLTLPAVKSNIFAQEEPHKYVDFFLGHDPVLDQYKVVCSVAIASKDFERITSEYWVFVLEAGGSWKRIEFDQQPHRPLHPGLCIDGVIYYLADTSISHDIVVSFDVRSEEFSMINAPDVVSQIAKSVGFTEYGGKPAILDHTDLVEFGSVELWVVEDGGKWSKKSLVLQPCQMHLLDNSINVEVEGTTRKGEFFLTPIPRLPVPMYSLDYILYYDLQRNDLRKVDIIKGISEHEFIDPYTHLKLMDKCESIMHLEI